MTRIDQEAGPAVAVAAVPAVLALLVRRPRIALALATLPLAVAAFFRDPDRTPDSQAPSVDDVLSPADGKVMYAGPGQQGVAPDGAWQQVSIFLSAFDVHINRAPYGGRITEVVQRPGTWLAAYKHESAHLNERSDITVEREVGGVVRRVHYRQIVGLMARRVVTRVAAGDVVRTALAEHGPYVADQVLAVEIVEGPAPAGAHVAAGKLGGEATTVGIAKA